MNSDTHQLSICEMCVMYESGMTLKQIANVAGVCITTVFHRLKKTNCKMRNRGLQKGTKLPAEWVERIGAAKRGVPKPESMKRKLSESKKCHYNGLNGFGHTKRHSRGYELVYAPDHPRAHADGYVLKHTVIAERMIGRYLHDNEEVHHINHIRDDNTPENLIVMDAHEHRTMHMLERNAKRRNDLSIG